MVQAYLLVAMEGPFLFAQESVVPPYQVQLEILVVEDVVWLVQQ
jgi:hypothetical protein